MGLASNIRGIGGSRFGVWNGVFQKLARSWRERECSLDVVDPCSHGRQDFPEPGAQLPFRRLDVRAGVPFAGEFFLGPSEVVPSAGFQACGDRLDGSLKKCLRLLQQSRKVGPHVGLGNLRGLSSGRKAGAHGVDVTCHYAEAGEFAVGGLYRGQVILPVAFDGVAAGVVVGIVIGQRLCRLEQLLGVRVLLLPAT